MTIVKRAWGLVLAIALPLGAADEEHPYERSGWLPTGSARGGKPVWTTESLPPTKALPPPPRIVKAEPAKPAAAPAAPAPKAAEPPNGFERSPWLGPRRPRPAWVTGDVPPG